MRIYTFADAHYTRVNGVWSWRHVTSSQSAFLPLRDPRTKAMLDEIERLTPPDYYRIQAHVADL